MTQMIEKEGLVFHGKCIKSEIEALHNMILMSINDESQYYKVITFEDKAMESLEKIVMKRQKARNGRKRRGNFPSNARNKSRKVSARAAIEIDACSK